MKKFLFILLTVHCSLFTAQAQWHQTNGPFGGTVNCFALKGDTIFAGTGYTGEGGGVFLSTNNGASWFALNNGLPNTAMVTSLTISGKYVFAGTATSLGVGKGVFLSTNNGTSWMQDTTGIGCNYVTSLAVMGTKIFAGTYENGVFLSTNNGASWTAVNNGLSNTCVSSLAISDTNIFAGTAYYGGVFLSTNNGASWTAMNNGLFYYDGVNSLAISGKNIFAGTGNAGVYLSTDNGASWAAMNNGFPLNDWEALTSLATNGKNIFAGTLGYGVFLSTDNGSNWKAININTGLTNLNVKSIATNGNNIFAGTVGGGIFLSTNNGVSWSSINAGLINTQVTSLAVIGTNIFAGTGGSGMFLSTNNGSSWIEDTTGIGCAMITSVITANPKPPNTYIFASTSDKGVFLSQDSGATWASFGLQNNDITALAFMGFYNYSGYWMNMVFAGAGNSSGLLYESTFVSGSFDSWSLCPQNSFGENLYCIIQTLYNNGGSLFTKCGGLVYVSYTQGYAWQPTTSNPFGYTWSNNGLTDTNAINIISLAISGSNFFISTAGNGVFLSTDNGASWTSVGLTSLQVNTLVISGGYIFAGTKGEGVWKRALSEMVGINEHPTPYTLLPTFIIYPNPASDYINIEFQASSFQLPASFVIYDVLGNKFHSESFRPQTSDFVHKIDISTLNSGLYFLKASTNTAVRVSKFIKQ